MTLKQTIYRIKGWWLARRAPEAVPSDIPVVINSYNRLTTLRMLVGSLLERGITNIIILDNASTYGPLLEWYERECSCRVIHLGANLGYKAMWLSELTRELRKGWFVYTDSDVMLSPECPADVMERLYRAMTVEHPRALKAGLSIRIDDLPDCFAQKQEVIAAESRFWTERVGDMYRAAIDTTFALYRPGSGLNRSRSAESYRLAPPYTLVHLPWYADSAHPTEEELHYARSCRQPTTWSSRMTAGNQGDNISSRF